MLPARIPLLLVGLLAAQQSSADVKALLACRQLTQGQARADCLERESARLEAEQAGATEIRTAPMSQHAVAAARSPAPTQSVPAPKPAGIAPKSADDGRGELDVASITYRDGRPLFTLANSQRWLSREERQLTEHPGSDVVTLERSPAGTVLHFNHSFYGLHVTRLP